MPYVAVPEVALLTASADTLGSAMVRDTLARIIESGDYSRGVRETLLARFLSWMGGMWQRLIDAAGDSPVVRWGAIALLALIAAAVIGRIVWLWVLERRALARLEKAAGARIVDGEDPLVAARRAAAGGEYSAAVHLLYRALLVRLARSERLRLHPAKTAGDYARELRVRNSNSAAPFRDFARAYDRAVYGTPVLDAGSWERLSALATPMLD